MSELNTEILTSSAFEDYMVNEVSSVLTALFILLFSALVLLLVKGYWQYKLAKHLKQKNPWFGFVPLFALAQWWQMGGVSLWWIGIVFIPGVLDIFLSANVVALFIILVFLGLYIIAVVAGIGIAKKEKLQKVYGFGLVLPFTRWYLMAKIVQKQKLPQKNPFVLGLLLILGSLGVSLIVWGLLLYFSFGDSMISLYKYASDPNVTPFVILNDLLHE